MKRVLLFAGVAIAFLAGVVYNSRQVNAQSIGAGPVTSTTLAGCPPKTTGTFYFCLVTNDPANPSGVYLTANGANYFLLQPAAAAGVTTFNGRNGAVIAVPGDYSFGQLSGQIVASQLPTTTTCTLAAQVGVTNTVTISNCK